ncbi:CLUMA_CG006393, isoform A [Clunio marinus]|uniref:CLUMA_CG006393, isoform A n=1 Tax=Clunio marinus TaxID=568069 RepID=A0A1J1I1T9_9DIPT|nr:CLUMA_CG006393, isoform A [Clunio marinus]
MTRQIDKCSLIICKSHFELEGWCVDVVVDHLFCSSAHTANYYTIERLQGSGKNQWEQQINKFAPSIR